MKKKVRLDLRKKKRSLARVFLMKILKPKSTTTEVMMKKDTIKVVEEAVVVSEAAEEVAVALEAVIDHIPREAIEDKEVEIEKSINIKMMTKMRVIVTVNQSITKLKEEATRRKI